MSAVEVAPIHEPSREAVDAAQMTAFARECERRTGRALPDWESLYAFSVEESRVFWRTFLDWSGAIVEGEPEPVCVGDVVETARFFPDLRLNYAENLLRTDVAGGDDTAIGSGKCNCLPSQLTSGVSAKASSTARTSGTRMPAPR